MNATTYTLEKLHNSRQPKYLLEKVMLSLHSVNFRSSSKLENIEEKGGGGICSGEVRLSYSYYLYANQAFYTRQTL